MKVVPQSFPSDAITDYLPTVAFRHLTKSLHEYAVSFDRYTSETLVEVVKDCLSAKMIPRASNQMHAQCSFDTEAQKQAKGECGTIGPNLNCANLTNSLCKK